MKRKSLKRSFKDRKFLRKSLFFSQPWTTPLNPCPTPKENQKTHFGPKGPEIATGLWPVACQIGKTDDLFPSDNFLKIKFKSSSNWQSSTFPKNGWRIIDRRRKHKSFQQPWTSWRIEFWATFCWNIRAYPESLTTSRNFVWSSFRWIVFFELNSKYKWLFRSNHLRNYKTNSSFRKIISLHIHWKTFVERKI